MIKLLYLCIHKTIITKSGTGILNNKDNGFRYVSVQENLC
jgi:hypothetical protein